MRFPIRSASAAAPKTKLKGFSFGGSSKGKKGDAFQEWKRGKPEKPSEPAALVLRREEDAVVPKSLAPASDAKPKRMLGTDHVLPFQTMLGRFFWIVFERP